MEVTSDARDAVLFEAMREARIVVPPRLHRPFTIRYLTALLLVAILAISADLTLERLIKTNTGAAAQVNLSGRQRMLSQRIALQATLLAQATGNPDTERAQIKSDAALMLGTQRALIDGDSRQQLPGHPSAALRSLYLSDPDAVAHRVQSFTALATEVAADEHLTSTSRDLADLQSAATGPLVPALNDVVASYERQSDERNADLSRDERILVGLTLSILALEAALVFRPMSRRIAIETSRLADASRRHRIEAVKQRFSVRLRDALELAADEPTLLNTVERAIVEAGVPGTSELLLIGENNRLHLAIAAGPEEARPCSVTDPGVCAALRRGKPITTRDSSLLGSCPKLAADGAHPISASCVPLMFLGTGLGVLKIVGPVGAETAAGEHEVLETLATQAGNHLGTLRAFVQTTSAAHHDALTGLLNRRGLEASIPAGDSEAGPLLVLMADIDHFKKVNDDYGHDGGDAALQRVADTLRSTLRPGDLISRYGGEEFLILAPVDRGLDIPALLEAGVALGERLRCAVESATHDSDGPTLTVSIGVSWSGSSDTTQAVLSADRALYLAKSNGRNQVRTGSDLNPSRNPAPTATLLPAARAPERSAPATSDISLGIHNV